MATDTTPTPHGAPELPPLPKPGYGYFSGAQMREYAHAAIQQAAGAVPEGLKLVPVEPTSDMLFAGARSIIDGQDERHGSSWADEAELAYKAMLAASPSPLARESGSSDHLVPCAGGGVTQWQPIETAPKDGSYVLLYAPPQVFEGEPITERLTHGHWSAPSDIPRIKYQDGYAPEPEWDEWEPYWASSDGGFTEENPPTHWMPLPAAPTSQINPGSAPREGGHE